MKTHKILAFVAAMMIWVGCTEDITTGSTINDGHIRFSVALDDSVGNMTLTRSIAAQDTMSPVMLSGDDEQPLFLHTYVEPFPTSTATRSTMINNVTTDLAALGCFGVSGYHYDPATQSINSVNANFFHNAKVTVSGGEWRTAEPYYFPASNERMSFYAYSPYTATGGTNDVNRVYGDAATDYGPMILEYTVSPDPTQQTDLITASANNIPFDPGTDVDLSFSHALTAVRFVLGDEVALGWTLTELSIEKIINHARYKVGTGWLTNESDATTGTFTLSLNKLTSDTDRSVTGSTQTFLMIPQTFSNSQQQLTIKLTKDNVDKTLHYKLAGSTWTAGTMITYAITTSSINVVTPSISYPTDWGGEAFTLKDSYDDGISVGVYAVDINTKKMVTKNMQLTYDETTGTWATSGDDVLKYNRNYDYYFYYPYKSNITDGLGDTFSGSGASAFFSGVISNWTVTDDQSDAEKLLPNDLHIGQAVHDTENFTQVSVAMQHALGLAKITLEEVDVTPRVNFVSGNSAKYTDTYRADLEDKLIYRASNQDIKNYMCPNEDMNIYYYIVKGTQSKTFSSSSTGTDAWKNSLTNTFVNGQCYTATAQLKTIPDIVEYDGWYYQYTGEVQTFSASPGIYKISCWGAQGADPTATVKRGGRGGYTTGTITLTSAIDLYIYIGQGPTVASTTGGWNGGNSATFIYDQTGYASGGATDIRLEACTGGTTVWNEFNSLKSRIMVAGGGGGSGAYQTSYGIGGAGGGLNGITGDDSYYGATYSASGGSQTDGGNAYNDRERYNGTIICYTTVNKGTFGKGGYNVVAQFGGCAGGGGWYGGGAATRGHGGGGGGSSYVSGLDGCRAITESSTASSISHSTSSVHYSGYQFSNASTVAGNDSSQPRPAKYGGTQTGQSGNGYVEIIKIN